jgi:hypothetical protein
MQVRSGSLGLAALAAGMLLVSTALSDDRGVGARTVKIVQRPGKALVKVVLGGEGAEEIHKGAAGDPALMIGQMFVCVDSTLGFFSTEGWQRNTETSAAFTASPGASASIPGLLHKATVKTGRSSRWIAHNLGGMNLGPAFVPSPPVQGALAVAIHNANDGSFHRLCANLESAESVNDRPLAGGAGRQIVWKNVAPDPGCAHFDATLPVICSPSGAFLDGPALL